MTDQLHPQRQSYPLVNTDDELVMVFRHALPSTLVPTVYLKAISEAQFRIDSSRTLDDRAGYEVLNYSNGTLDTVTITVNGGAPTILTEGTDFDAVVSNAETAIQIAAAINAAGLGLVATTEEGQPYVYISAAANSGVKTFTLASGDLTAWTSKTLASVGLLNTLSSAASTSILLPSNTTDPTYTVSFLKILSGRLSVDVQSPVEVRTYFRQPSVLNPTTGHNGGWPTSP